VTRAIIGASWEGMSAAAPNWGESDAAAASAGSRGQSPAKAGDRDTFRQPPQVSIASRPTLMSWAVLAALSTLSAYRGDGQVVQTYRLAIGNTQR